VAIGDARGLLPAEVIEAVELIEDRLGVAARVVRGARLAQGQELPSWLVVKTSLRSPLTARQMAIQVPSRRRLTEDSVRRSAVVFVEELDAVGAGGMPALTQSIPVAASFVVVTEPAPG